MVNWVLVYLLPNLFVIQNSTNVNIEHGVRNFPMHTSTSPMNRLKTLTIHFSTSIDKDDQSHFQHLQTIINILLKKIRPCNQPQNNEPLCPQIKPCPEANTASYYHYGTILFTITLKDLVIHKSTYNNITIVFQYSKPLASIIYHRI